MNWYVNAGLSTLIKQMKAEQPGMTIGTIGDANHSSTTSDHNPDPDGSVDAIDPMINARYSFSQAQRDVNRLVNSRDRRIGYLIFNKRIISSTVQPWVWRTYTGTSDPHTNHWHLSSRDAYEKNSSEWEGFKTLMPAREIPWTSFDIAMPLLQEGDDDNKIEGYDRIKRIQRLIGFTGDDVDGIWGPKTSSRLGYKTMTVERWAKLLGLGLPA